MFLGWRIRVLLCALACVPLVMFGAADTPQKFLPRSNDVVGFVGGSDVAAAQFTGHLETLFVLNFPGARFRDFGWEGDTVFAQPRDVGFPPLNEHLKRAGATILFVEFGRAETLSSGKSVSEFFAAYEKLLNEFAKQTPRIVLVTPPPFERAAAPLPDLSKRNKELAAHANAVRTLAQKRGLPLVDLFQEFGGALRVEPLLTDNGLQLTPRGHALIAAAFARQLGFSEIATRAGEVNTDGAWLNPQFEKLRQLVMEKDRLWFNYWRPQNWAFLGGDRVSQPSSHDHRDPKVRWFPVEMERYGPLIREKEMEMEQFSADVRGGMK